MSKRKVPQAHFEVSRVAALLDMSPRWVKDQIKSGNLRGIRLGNKIVVEAESLNELMAKCDITGNTRKKGETV